MPGEGGFVRKAVRSAPGISTVSVQQAVSGTYQCEQLAGTAVDLTGGTEYEIAAVAANILANTANKDELFSWLKAKIFFADSASSNLAEWYLCRLTIAEADPDLDDEAIVEALHKDGKILKHDWIQFGHWTYRPWGKIEFEVFNVKLRYGEELRLLLLPYATGANTVEFKGRMEWRQQGK